MIWYAEWAGKWSAVGKFGRTNAPETSTFAIDMSTYAVLCPISLMILPSYLLFKSANDYFNTIPSIH